MQFQVSGFTAERRIFLTYRKLLSLPLSSPPNIFPRTNFCQINKSVHLLWSFIATEQAGERQVRGWREKQRTFWWQPALDLIKMKLASVPKLRIWLLERQTVVLILNKWLVSRLHSHEGNFGISKRSGRNLQSCFKIEKHKHVFSWELVLQCASRNALICLCQLSGRLWA